MFQTEGTQTTQMWTSCFLHQGSYMWGKYQEPGYGSKLNPTRSQKWSVMIVLSSLSRVNSGPIVWSIWSICRIIRVAPIFYGQIIYRVPVWGLFSCQALGHVGLSSISSIRPTLAPAATFLIGKAWWGHPISLALRIHVSLCLVVGISVAQWPRAPRKNQAAGLVWGGMFRKIWCSHHYLGIFPMK